MKLRKLVMCILVAIVLFGLTGVDVSAEETSTPVTTATTISTADTNTVTTVTEAATVTEEEATEATIEETDKDTNADDTVKETETKETTKKETNKTKEKAALKYSKADLRLLSSLLFCEAGGESYNGKLAVAIVVMNRKRSSAFPDTIKGVIYQKSQFGPARNGSLSKALSQYDAGKFTSASEKACIKAAKAALSGTKVIIVAGKEKNFSKYLYFSGWLKNATYKLGHHQFK